MKIEINLDGFIEGSDGEGYRLSEALENEIVLNLTGLLQASANKILKEKLDETITILVKNKTEEFATKLLPELMDYEFTETTSWGEKKGTYTVRNRILKAFEEHCHYEKKSYSSERNQFTKIVDEIVEKRLSEFVKQFQLTIDEKFTEACFKVATERLQAKLKVGAV